MLHWQSLISHYGDEGKAAEEEKRKYWVVGFKVIFGEMRQAITAEW